MPAANKKTNLPGKTETPTIKTKPTIFPLGFAVSLIEDGSVIIDFVDVLNQAPTILESIALSKEKANALSAALMRAIENGKSED
jgi:hypothetical protein